MNRRKTRKDILTSMALLAGLSISLQALSPAGIAAPTVPATTPSASALVKEGKAELAKNNVDKAIVVLSKAAKILGTKPGSCECHMNLGKALCMKAKKTKNQADFVAAKKELRTAIRVGAGNAISKQANDYMMANMPKELLQPRSGEGTELIAAKLGLRTSDRGMSGSSKPRIFEFYADWCEPCKLLEPVMAKIKTEYGDQVEVTRINVDDKNNADMLEQYDVSPIPTVIYMNPDGQVVGYSIGYAGEKTVQKEVQKLLPIANNKT
jgi:thiol-disulfide isomerase/thioredoxin